ncbi:MAG: hypothetical protein MUC92_14100 [Fimbriimonadaceae bacterium]|jgi:hypothetical protein|nr:hypothetical protein [Fimbriimonadaceae bacterium]
MLKTFAVALVAVLPFAINKPWFPDVQAKSFDIISANFKDSVQSEDDYSAIVEEAEGRPELLLYGFEGFGTKGSRETCNSIQFTVNTELPGVVAALSAANLPGLTTTKINRAGSESELFHLKGGALGTEWLGTIEELDEEDGLKTWFVSLFSKEKMAELGDKPVNFASLTNGIVALAGKTYNQAKALIGAPDDFLDNGAEVSTLFYQSQNRGLVNVEFNTSKRDWQNSAKLSSLTFYPEDSLSFAEILKQAGLDASKAKQGTTEEVEGESFTFVTGAGAPSGYVLFVIRESGTDRFYSLTLLSTTDE